MCQRSGRPAMGFSTLPGRRVDPIRACMTATTRGFFGDLVMPRLPRACGACWWGRWPVHSNSVWTRLRCEGRRGQRKSSGFALIAGADVAKRAHAIFRVRTPGAVRKLGWLRPFEAGAIGDQAFADACNHGCDLMRQPAMARRVFRAVAIQIEVELH